ncbi:MAG: cyclase family protein [Chloroflexi bacterium]|nr:cyclase family protein [Chloroflexota bacterium]
MTDLDRLIGNARVFDLAHPLEQNMPVSPNHPGFRMALQRRHGDMVRPDGGSASNEMIVMGGHTGTHLDALCHVSQDGKLFGGIDAAAAQTGARFNKLGLETVPPFVCRGVLLDVAAYQGVDCLPAATPITAADLQATASAQGTSLAGVGAVLVRSGWTRHWTSPHAYLGEESGVPGPDVSAAEFIANAGTKVTGHDSMAYECLAPGAGHRVLPVHRVLLVERGIHIIENVAMEELSRARQYEFLFVVASLKIVGGTGSPVRPLAIVM